MCEMSWAEVQVGSFSFECSAKMKELEAEMEQLRQLIVKMVGREEVGCAYGSGGETVHDKVGEDDERDSRESSPQLGRRLRGGNNRTLGDGMKGDGTEGNGRDYDGSEGERSEIDGSEGNRSKGDEREEDGSEGDAKEGDRSEGDMW